MSGRNQQLCVKCPLAGRKGAAIVTEVETKRRSMARNQPTVSRRRDGRKAMLVYMKPPLIQAVKDAAAAGDQKAWQFVEKAVELALRSKGRDRPRSRTGK